MSKFAFKRKVLQKNSGDKKDYKSKQLILQSQVFGHFERKIIIILMK